MEASGELTAEQAIEVEQRARRLSFLRRRFRFPKPDRSPIYEWAHRHIVLPASYAVPGAFDVRTSPWLIPVFDALQDDRIRRVHLRKGIQVGGTLVADVWIPWLIVNDPGAMSFTMHVDDMVELHAKMRLNPLLDACKPVAALLPRHGPMRSTTQIHFGGFSLILNAANLSDQQSQSIRYKINDETWHPKWQGVYGHALGRISAFENVGTSKALDISQAGIEGDVEDVSFRGGDRQVWSAECPSCHKPHPVSFCIRESEDPEAKQSGGVVWDDKAKGEDDIWNVARAIETTRFRCPCGHEYADTDETRERWKRSGRYVATNPKASPDRRSFHVESIVSRPMSMLVDQWLSAVNEQTRMGNENGVIEFRQKREAKPWRVAKTSVNIINVASSTYATADYADGSKRVPGEFMRAMTIDRQQVGFWVEVGAWTIEPQYYQLWFGKVDTIDAVRALQQKYQIPDACVAQDRRYQPSKTDEDSVRFGWRGMMGATQGRKTWAMLSETSGEMSVFPHSDPKFAVVGGGHEAPYYEWSGDHAKDLLFNALNGKGIKWNLPRDTNPLYLEHLKSEAKEQVRPGVWRYVEQVQNKNHGLDCSSMMMMIAIIAGIVRFKLDEAK
jgi:hypothetical protein